MCGLVGEFLLTPDGKPPQESILKAMGETLIHRGPDGSGLLVGDGFGLYHRRLAIIDLERGDQPMTSLDGSVALAFNGEIYNFPTLRRELTQKGHTFRTATDTEVLIHGYQEWGMDLPKKLRGMFAFALVDLKHRRLLLARDRLGQKPLYFVLLADRILFASEPKALLRHPDVNRRLHPGALWESLIFRYVPDPHCIFQDMEKLPPATLLSANQSGHVRQERYWDISFSSPCGEKQEDQAQRVRDLLDQAVRIRLVSDVPLGAFLSGGIDSAAVVDSMRRSQDDVLAVSVGFSEGAFDERPFARIAAKRFGVELKEHLTTSNADQDLACLADHFDEPFFDSSALPTLHVCRAARQHVTVALSGDGGDEGYAGYRRYRFDRLENRIRSLVPGLFRRYLVAPIGRKWPRSPRLPRFLRAGATLENLGRDPFVSYIYSVSSLSPEEAFSMLHPDLRRLLCDYDPLAIHREHFSAAGPVDQLSKVQYLDLKTYLPGDILVKVDRASMAVSLEARAPFLDHHLLAQAASIPPSLRIRGSEGKWLLRRALKDRLGPESLGRPKQGFSIPLAHWLRHELRPQIESALHGEAAEFLLNQTLLHNWYEEHLQRRRDRSEPLWALLVLHRWWLRWGGELP